MKSIASQALAEAALRLTRSVSVRSSFKQSAGRARAAFLVLPDGPRATKAGHPDWGNGSM